ncbi:transglutaminase domain-containing protein [Virgibacillus oceani]
MRYRKIFYLPVILLLVFAITGCAPGEEQPDEVVDEGEQVIAKEEPKEAEIENIQLTDYAEEVGFSLTSPEQDNFTVNTIISLEGAITEANNLTSDHLWVVLTGEEALEEFPQDEFNYYVKIEDGTFSHDLNLHQGAGDYEVSVRAPSNNLNEEVYYEMASFQVTNEDEAIAMDVQYTEYGVFNDVQLQSPELGWQQGVEESVLIEGTVPEDHAGDMVLVQVEKDNEDRQIMFPIEDSVFQGKVPLYFGEGIHHVSVQSYDEAEGLYYEAASFYADNQAAAEFAQMEKFNQYIDRGVTLHEPAWDTNTMQSNQEYRIAGEIDPDMPGAEAITHIIVTVKKLDAEDEEAGYVIPIENYQFDGMAYFRFGSGNYEVIVNVPDHERQNQSMFYFEGVARIQHEVIDIPDERGLLPSRGIESEHPTIIEQAEEITSGLTSQREKAKAIYQFVAQHVAYDVEKAEADIFNIDDSALSTLESGVGICQDYAFLATALFRAIGMEAHYVEGYAGERHAWVEVMVDGEWLEMDPTWGAGYVQDGEFHFHYNEDYFDPDPAFLAETHTREGIMY